MTNSGKLLVSPHSRVLVPWRQSVRGGSKDDRMLREVTTSIPPDLVDLVFTSEGLDRELEAALAAVTSLDVSAAEFLGPVAGVLLRAESVASSKIEGISATMNDYARALHGHRGNSAASAMAAATAATQQMIESVDSAGEVTGEALLETHRLLMESDVHERVWAGRWRDMQNWIGGSDHSPLGALYVPPPAEVVETKIDDLIRFCSRTDLNPFVQAAVAHAQFESIHPFTDGNGRVGRALTNAVLRARGVTGGVLVPIASALAADRENYFNHLNAYREGDAGPLVGAFARSAVIAAEESLVTANRFRRMPEQWLADAERPREGSAARRLLDGFFELVIFSADEAEAFVGASTSSTYEALKRLESFGVIRPLTERKRDQVWVVASVADELDGLSDRIAARARTELKEN